MSTITRILQQTDHRPIRMPDRNWRYYQEWNRLLFLHWEIEAETLRPFVPPSMEIDQLDGKCYVSFVAFTMNNIRPAYLPPVPGLSDFHELNLRTYVRFNGEPGIYFLSLEAGNALSAFVAARISGLPYQYSSIDYSGDRFAAQNNRNASNFYGVFIPGDQITEKTTTDLWLTERYQVYFEQNQVLWRYDVHHAEWKLNKVIVPELRLNYRLNAFDFSTAPSFAHYSAGVKVVAWNKQLVKK